MAGWDEEALLVASLVVEDTPDRQSKHKKRSDLIFKTPPSTTSRRKRRAQRRSPVSTPITPLKLDEEGTSKQEVEAGKAAGALNGRKVERQSPESGTRSTRRTRSTRPPMVSTSTRDASLRKRGVMSQDYDAALALRLQSLSLLVSTDASTRRRRETPSQDEDAALALRLQREAFMESFRGTHSNQEPLFP